MTVSEISKTQALAATAILSLVATALLVLNLDGTWMHPDTAQALSVARNFQQGHGFKTSILYYEEHYSLNAWPASQTVFPVGYPAMMVALGWAGIPLRTACTVIGVTGFFLAPLLICVAAMRMGRRPLTACLLAVMWLCFPMIWHNVWERQTEMMFISLTLSSLILLQSQVIAYRKLLVAGLLAATAVSLRYAGVFWLMSVSPVFLIQFPQKRSAAVKQALTFLAIPAIVVASLFVRNVMLIGDFKGGSTKSVHRTLKEAAENAYYAGSRLTGLDKTHLITGHIAEVAAATGLCLLAIAVFICLFRLWNPEYRKRLRVPSIGQAAVFFYIFVSLVALIGLEKTTPINLSPRMLFPLIPFILLACADVISRTFAAFPDHSHFARFARPTVRIASVLLIFGVLGGQFRAAEEVRTYVHRFGRVNDVVSQRIETPTGLISPRELIQNTRILSDEPDMLGEAVQQGVVGLTSNTYTKRIWSDDEVIALVRRYQINRIVLFPSVLPKDKNQFFESLMKDVTRDATSRPWLQPIVISPQIQVYAVRDSLLLTQYN